MSSRRLPYRELFESNPHPMWVYHRDTLAFLAVNDAAVARYGWSREEFLGMTLLDIRPAEERDAFDAKIATDPDGLDHSGLWRHRTKSGEEMLVQISSHSLTFADQRARFVVAYDLTAHQAVQSELRAQTALLSIAGRVAHFGGWVVDLATDRVVWTDETCAIHDEPVGTSVTGEGAIAYYAPEYQPQVREAFRRCARLGTPVEFEVELITAQGRRRWVRAVGEGVRNGEGQVSRIQGAFTDITERKRAETERDRSEERFRILARVTTDAVWDWDLTTDDIIWSEGMQAAFGFVVGEPHPTGALWRARIHPDDRDRVERSLDAVIAGSGSAWSDEYRLMRSDGAYAVVADRGSVIRTDDGRPIRMIGGLQDLTERRALEAQFLRAQRMESIGTLAGGIAHDLNNMLSPILMSVDLLRDHVADRLGHEIVDTIESSAQRGADLVRQVLTFARGVDGQRLPIALRAFALDLVKIVGETFPKGIQVRVEIPDGTWAIIGDPTQMHQVFLNLSLNARDAMPEGGVLTLRSENVAITEREAVQIADARAGTYVRVSVSDTGHGMSTRVRERIFEPFFTTKEVGKGTGLGLSTVQAIVRSHGGFVTVRSAPGEGTTFDVHLPADPGAAESTGLRRRHSPGRGVGELILLVDDEPNIRTFAMHLLERSGYRVLVAASGDEAIALFGARARDIALVISDVQMPGTDGRAVMRAIQRIAPAVPVIAMSGLDARELVTSTSEGNIVHLMKPFSSDGLADAVRRALAMNNTSPSRKP